MTVSIRLALYGLLVAVIFGAGWKAKGWKNDSEQAAVERATRAIVDKINANDSNVASIVELKLADLKANQTVIDRGIIREIQNPIYRNVCLQPDLVRMLNAAARGEASDASGKPAGALPGDAKPAD